MTEKIKPKDINEIVPDGKEKIFVINFEEYEEGADLNIAEFAPSQTKEVVEYLKPLVQANQHQIDKYPDLNYKLTDNILVIKGTALNITSETIKVTTIKLGNTEVELNK